MFLIFRWYKSIDYSFSAKNIYQTDDLNDEPREIILSDNDLNRLERFEELFKNFQNQRNRPQAYDRYQAFGKRAKAIIKGDPREFMG